MSMPPVVGALALLAVVRGLVLALLFLSLPVAPAAAWRGFLVNGAYYTAEAVWLGVVLLVLWRMPRAGRAAATLVAVTLLPAILLLAIIDPILFRITGDRLTPSVLRQFAGWDLFTSDHFWAPVRTYWYAVVPGVALLGAFVIGMARSLRDRRGAEYRPGRGAAIVAGTAALALVLPTTLCPQLLLEPVEVLFLRELAGIDGERFSPSQERRTMTALREFVGLPHGARWLDDRYPLVYGYPDTMGESVPVKEAVSPDLVVVVIESLRGENVRWANPSGPDLVSLPALEALSRRSVVFPQFVANGFPSAVGYIGITQSAWPHLRKRIAAEHTHIALDGLPQRLRSRGYFTLHVEAAPNFDKERHWAAFYERDINLGARGIAPTERHLVDETIAAIEAQDRSPTPRPLFALFITHNPHLPYETPDDRTDQLSHGPSLLENYRSGMAYVDRHLARLFDFLARRPRGNDTVIFVTGDHANFLDQGKSTGLPVNDTIWTSAFVCGPHERVGPPRVDARAASQVDLGPTIARLAGDRRPSAMLGRDLLSPEARPSQGVIAIRSGGLRLERGDGGWMADPRLPAAGWPSEALPLRPPTPAGPLPDPAGIMEVLRYWTYLLDHDRVWAPRR